MIELFPSDYKYVSAIFEIFMDTDINFLPLKLKIHPRNIAEKTHYRYFKIRVDGKNKKHFINMLNIFSFIGVEEDEDNTYKNLFIVTENYRTFIDATNKSHHINPYYTINSMDVNNFSKTHITDITDFLTVGDMLFLFKNHYIFDTDGQYIIDKIESFQNALYESLLPWQRDNRIDELNKAIIGAKNNILIQDIIE